MRKPFDGNYPLTQEFGVNKDNYKQFNIEGHNGLDYGLPLNTPVKAPHAGKVIEANFDAGYGNYVKIENEEEGSVLAHLNSISVKVGFMLMEGDLIGVSGSTGNSTGPHLHWGYYQIPRNRANGFNGFINQLTLISEVVSTTYTFKYKNNDEIEPAVFIAVGAKPFAENMQYGKVGPEFPAKILNTTIINSTPYYNIDQRYIGGGTGWVQAVKIDSVAKWIPSMPEKEAVVQYNKTYTEEQYRALEEERNQALELAKANKEECTNASITLSAFKALGFENAEDITKELNKRDDTIIGLNKQLQEVYRRNKTLLQMVQDKEDEDSTAIDEGLKAIQEAKEHKDALNEIAKKVNTKPSLFEILFSIENIQKIAEVAMKIKKKPQSENQKKENYNFDWLLDIFELKKGGV